MRNTPILFLFIVLVFSSAASVAQQGPNVSGQVQMPQELTWVNALGDYAPNPFNITASVVNTGDETAYNVEFELLFDPADLVLLSPVSPIQPGTPADIAPTEMSEASWLVRAKPRKFGDSIRVGVRVTFDNHPDIMLMHQIWVPPVPSKLQCDLQPIRLVADYESQRYEPMPFQMNVPVWNTGTDTARGIEATVFFNPDLMLAGPDSPNQFTKPLTPGALEPGDTGMVDWTFSHPLTIRDTTYTVEVMLVDDEGDTSWCQTTVFVPGFNVPSLRMTCVTPDVLVFDENIGEYGEYVPNPFNVSVTVVNVGGDPADSVSVFMYLPDGMEIDPPIHGQRVSVGTLEPWQPGDPYPTVTWSVRYTERPRGDVVEGFKFAAGGISRDSGLPADTVYSYCQTGFPGLNPVFECTLRSPDTVRLNASGSGLEPNPFSVFYTIRNTGASPGRIQQATCYYPNDGLSLSSLPGNTQTQMVDTLLAPGDSTVIEWIFDVAGRTEPRKVEIQVVAIDDEQNPIVCDGTLHIQALNTSLRCELTSTQTAIEYNTATGKYDSPAFKVTSTLTNIGGLDLSNIQAQISNNDVDGYTEFDPSYAGSNTNPKSLAVLFQGQSSDFSWNIILAKDNTTGQDQYVEYCVNYSSDQTPIIEDACCFILRIAPVNTTSTDDTPAALEFALGWNYPNPFSSVTEIPYALARDAEVSITVHNILGREVAQVVHERMEAGSHSARFDARDLPGGVYIVRLKAGDVTRSRVMMLQR